MAIRYEMESMARPMVVAKGKNYLALRIRQKAIENKVPIVENPPLAQALYKSVEVGQEIPAHFYRAVAEILAYIYRLMHGRCRHERQSNAQLPRTAALEIRRASNLAALQRSRRPDRRAGDRDRADHAAAGRSCWTS